MRLFAALVVGVGALAAIAAPAGASKKPALPTVLEATTGRITALDMSHVAVGRVDCRITSKTAALAGNFAVGENVVVRCLGKTLETIKLAPLTGGHAGQPIRITGQAPASTPTRSTDPIVSSESIHGAVTSVTATSVTIGEVTCPIDATMQVTAQLRIGEVIGMSCTTYASGDRDSQISVPA